jgi:hypothetical protein
VKNAYKILEDLVWLTQLGFSMLFPLVVLVAGAWWAVGHWGWPTWVYIPAFLIGIACGASTLAHFGRMMLRRAAKENKNARVGFNRHQ